MAEVEKNFIPLKTYLNKLNSQDKSLTLQDARTITIISNVVNELKKLHDEGYVYLGLGTKDIFINPETLEIELAPSRRMELATPNENESWLPPTAFAECLTQETIKKLGLPPEVATPTRYVFDSASQEKPEGKPAPQIVISPPDASKIITPHHPDGTAGDTKDQPPGFYHVYVEPPNFDKLVYQDPITLESFYKDKMPDSGKNGKFLATVTTASDAYTIWNMMSLLKLNEALDRFGHAVFQYAHIKKIIECTSRINQMLNQDKTEINELANSIITAANAIQPNEVAASITECATKILQSQDINEIKRNLEIIYNHAATIKAMRSIMKDSTKEFYSQLVKCRSESPKDRPTLDALLKAGKRCHSEIAPRVIQPALPPNPNDGTNTQLTLGLPTRSRGTTKASEKKGAPETDKTTTTAGARAHDTAEGIGETGDLDNSPRRK